MSTCKKTNVDQTKKKDAIKEIKFMSQRDVAAKVWIGIGAVNWKVKRRLELELIGENINSPSIKRIKKSYIDDVNDLVWQWFVSERSKNTHNCSNPKRREP